MSVATACLPGLSQIAMQSAARNERGDDGLRAKPPHGVVHGGQTSQDRQLPFRDDWLGHHTSSN